MCETSTTLATPEELELIRAVSSKESAATEQLVRTYAPRMLSLARRMLRCEQDADDAVQDAFISIFRKAHTFSGASRLWTWLHRITINASLMRLRSMERHAAIETLLPTFLDDGHHVRCPTSWQDKDPLAHLSKNETREAVRRTIELLPPAYREVLLLRDIEELDADEVATLLGITHGNVKTRLHRARQALRTLLETGGENT